MMNAGKAANRTFLVLFLSGLAFGLFMVVSGHATYAEYSVQGGGGLAALFGLAAAGLGYLVIGVSVLAAGIPWVATAFLSRVDAQRSDNSGESDAVHAETAKSDDPESPIDSNDSPLNLIGAAWKGDEELWKVYWIYYWLFAIALSIGLAFSANLGLLAELVVRVVVAVWLVWIAVAQWRCSFNVRWEGWGYIVRVLLVISVIGWVFDFGAFIISSASS